MRSRWRLRPLVLVVFALAGCSGPFGSLVTTSGAALQRSSSVPRTEMSAAQEQVMFDFGGDGGRNPFAPPIADKNGALYGTTQHGGGKGEGAVFKLVPSGTTYNETTLWNFSGTPDGAEPVAGLIADKAGALYGTTRIGGGEQNFGTVFKLTPSGKTYTESVIHTFAGGSDGFWPTAGLTADKKGALYGTTSMAGGSGYGTAFRLVRSGKVYIATVLHSFGATGDGATPVGGLLVDKSGALYGTTYAGGSAGDGTVFKLTPSGKAYTESFLYSFKGGSDGSQPTSTLVEDASGALYGTTNAGGSNDLGTVFKLVPSGKTYAESVIYSFGSVSGDGAQPYAGLTPDGTGAFYGTTLAGGRGSGIVFKLTPSGGGYSESIVYTFGSGNDGSKPYGGVTRDGTGALYGTTWQGGSIGYGTAFKVTP